MRHPKKNPAYEINAEDKPLLVRLSGWEYITQVLPKGLLFKCAK
jgi:hypothetical protein